MGRLNKKLQDSLMSEIFILRRINHPNIIRLLDMIESPGKIHLVLEFCKGGDLSVYSLRVFSFFFFYVTTAGLPDNNIIHRELKPQKYDAKADLWSVGAILSQLVTGRTPFTGNSQIQLLQNIIKSTDLHFPADCRDLSLDCIDLCQKLLRRNPVERLTFEEFFGHPFRQSYELSRSRLGSRAMDDFLSSGSSPSRNMEESSQDDCLPFLLDDDSSGPEGSPSHLKRTSSMRSSSGFNIDARVERKETGSSPWQCTELTSRYRRVDDSQDSMDQDYVLVSGPPVDLPSSSSSSSKAYNFPFKSPSPPALDSQNSAPSTSHGSLDLGDAFEQPSTNSLTRISSLKKCAATIAELVHERIKSDKHLEAFSIQLAILAIWKQALHICHTQAISGLEGSPSQDINKLRGSSSRKHERITDISHDGLEEISSQIQRQFIRETEVSEELSKEYRTRQYNDA
ncbi:Protein kinase domain [Arabidopsis thaliana x Arabidopsis arenosa]|uniref:Protein kinase domain n=1 Tax=Arabidopsis thaliana x Arabidopsis arenosa TaxID=1240361 RepID=A0A8T1XJZ8_9BRAS|nr:Protein kinase domain [Arabidopsis thaliana x Arabidopsis arenosa]